MMPFINLIAKSFMTVSTAAAFIGKTLQCDTNRGIDME